MKAVDIFRALAQAKVKYCLLGRTAAVFFGLPVVTFDIDILIDRGEANARRLFKALCKLKAVSAMPNSMELELFLSSKVTRYSVGALMLDVLKWQDGFSKTSWARLNKMKYHGVTVCIADLHDLIQTKSQTPRRKDKADVRALEKLLWRKELRS